MIDGVRHRDGVGLLRWVAVVLGAGNAAITAFWLVGGTALLDTIGGEIERWGRERGAAVVLALTVVLLAKFAVTVVPVLAVRLVAARSQRLVRLFAWTSAAILVVYGGLLTVVGLLVQADVIRRPAGADDRALAWHAYFWDPWFLVWGLALGAWMWSTRPVSDPTAA